jgi:acetyl esterase/lipase
MKNILHPISMIFISSVALLGAKEPASKAATPASDHARVSYGKDRAQFVDVYLAKSDKPTPAILYIHGGGWNGGSADGITRTDVFGANNKNGEGLQAVLDQGISVVSVEYRFINAALKAGAKPPVEWPLRDAARALQFVRSKAKEWNIDKQRIGLTGSSAGGCSSLWLAMHPDMADPKSADPVARESTRPAFVGVLNAQSSLDPLQLTAWFKDARYGAHAFGFVKNGKYTNNPEDSLACMADCLAARDTINPWIQEYSPIAWAQRR